MIRPRMLLGGRAALPLIFALMALALPLSLVNAQQGGCPNLAPYYALCPDIHPSCPPQCDGNGSELQLGLFECIFTPGSECIPDVATAICYVVWPCQRDANSGQCVLNKSGGVGQI